MDVAELLNHYFVSVADELTAGLPSESFSNHNVRPIVKSFHFQPTNANEIRTIIKKINSKRYHKDEVQRFILNLVVPKIAPVLARHFNFCIPQGHYPVVLKHARVIPIFKSGDVYSACNYRKNFNTTNF